MSYSPNVAVLINLRWMCTHHDDKNVREGYVQARRSNARQEQNADVGIRLEGVQRLRACRDRLRAMDLGELDPVLLEGLMDVRMSSSRMQCKTYLLDDPVIFGEREEDDNPVRTELEILRDVSRRVGVDHERVRPFVLHHQRGKTGGAEMMLQDGD